MRWTGQILRRTVRSSVLLLLLIGPGCTTRSDTPIVGADSTLIYPSKLETDVYAAITFALRDSRNREEAEQLDQERRRSISRLTKERDKLTDLRADVEEELRAEAKKAADQARKAKESKSKKKSSSQKSRKTKAPNAQVPSKKPDDGASAEAAANTDRTKTDESKSTEPAKKTSETTRKRESKTTEATAKTAEKPKKASSKKAKKSTRDGSKKRSSRPNLSLAAIQDSLQAVEARLRQLAHEDSVSMAAPWKQQDADGNPTEERAFDLEEGARVRARIALENIYARGTQPLMIHLVWLNPARKRVFKKEYSVVPSDSTGVLYSSLTISPDRRTSGRYGLQVFLFRELIAEKSFELQGSGVEIPEADAEGAM